MTPLETPSRVWRRIEGRHDFDMPSLPSLPEADETGLSEGASSKSLSRQSTRMDSTSTQSLSRSDCVSSEDKQSPRAGSLSPHLSPPEVHAPSTSSMVPESLSASKHFTSVTQSLSNDQSSLVHDDYGSSLAEHSRLLHPITPQRSLSSLKNKST